MRLSHRGDWALFGSARFGKERAPVQSSDAGPPTTAKLSGGPCGEFLVKGGPMPRRYATCERCGAPRPRMAKWCFGCRGVLRLVTAQERPPNTGESTWKNDRHSPAAVVRQSLWSFAPSLRDEIAREVSRNASKHQLGPKFYSVVIARRDDGPVLDFLFLGSQRHSARRDTWTLIRDIATEVYARAPRA